MTVTYYLGGVLDGSLLTTANDVSIAAGATAVGKDTPIGTLTGYGELVPNGAPGTFPAYASEALTPWSGKGQIYPTSLLNQAILDGNWTPTLKCSVTGTSPSSITADLIVRVWIWNSVSNVATKYGVLTKTGNTITTTSTSFVFSAAGLQAIAPPTADDYLAFDTVINVTANSNGAGVGLKVRTNFSNSVSTGNATGQVVAPALVPARIIPMASALQGTSTRTITMVSSVANQRTIPMTSSLSGYPRRIIPMTSSVCGAALGNPYVQPIADSHFVSASGPHLIYKGNQIKLYGATCYLATQGGANTWLNTDASAVLNDLFLAAYNNGVSMIRITDYWDGSHVSAIDLPQLWANIDYCVTRAQQLGMFVMMDVSAYKNVLIANALDWTVAANWHDWLTFVGYHYRNTATSICWYNCIGEPSVPADQAGCNALAAFYGSLCDTVHAADNGTHLIEAGGLTHMNTVVAGLTDPTWWYQIYTLANNNICGYKTYSTNDLVYLSTIRSIMTGHSINKPLANNEFGAEQEQGDQTFAAFTNTLNMTINIGDTITALMLNTTIAQSILAGTIISVSGTENFVVATTTSSGTSLPVTSVTAQKAHVATDTVSALGFADTGHSMGDTVYNYYSAVLGLTTTIQKWNNTPRTLVATSVMGGDQAGTVSYVVWNLGYSSNPTSYDVSSLAGTSPISWALYGRKSRLDGYQPLAFPTSGIVDISIGGKSIIFDESTFTIAYKENEAWRAQFTVLDYGGNQVFPYRSKIKITDYTLGILFTGFLIDDVFDKSNMLRSGAIEHKIDCIGNESKAMKRTSNRLYSVPFPAAQGVIDMLGDTLTAEGVSAKYALSEVNTQALWNAGTLSGAIGASSLPGGDLELSPAGSDVIITEATTSDFASGTLTNVVATSNSLQLTSTQAIKVVGTAVDAQATGANLYCITKIWNGSQSTASGDYLEYSLWISSTSPYCTGGVNIFNTDGTNWGTSGAVDQNVFYNVNSFPLKDDLTNFASDQWYYRKVVIPAGLVGKTIQSVTVGLSDNTHGTYTLYVKNINYRDSGGTLKATFYSSGAPNTLQQLSNAGYINVAVTTPITYEKSGTRVSSAHSLTSAALASLSLFSWSASEQTQTKASGQQLTIETSLDGGASWQFATNRGKVPGLIPGQVLTSRTLTIRETLAVAGANPELAPVLNGCTVTINSAPSASKTDIWNADTTGNMGTGTIVALTNDSTGLYISGSYKNWNDGDVTTGQSLFGSNSPNAIEAYGYLRLTNGSVNEYTMQQFTFAGQHADFTAEMDVYLYPASGGNHCMIYRTTYWGNTDYGFAYEAMLAPGGVFLFHGTNVAGPGGATLVAQTSGVSFATDAWYRLKVVASGTSHKIYVDDVKYIDTTDSFRTASGYFGARIGIGANAITGYFNNFGVQDVTSGSRIAPSVSISSVGTVLDSFIDWDASIPDNCTLDIQANTGSGYVSCTKGATIPGCTPTTNVAGLSLLIKAVFTANNANVTPLLLGIGWSVSGAYSSSGSYTSPSLSLATVGQVGNTLVSWAGLEPANTTVLADTTIDNGSSWQTNVAPGSLVTAGGNQYAGLGTIGNITTQPDPTVDDFSTDTSANYTQNHGSGGSNATWTPDTANQRVTGVGGSQAFYAYTAISSVNMDVLCDMTRSDAGGLVWCYSDATHYYSVVVGDSQSSVATPNTLTLYRNGTSVASATITFTRGLMYRVRASIASGVINVSFDGTTLITYTDGSPLVAGKAGLFNNGGTTDFIGLWIQPLGDDVTSKNVKARIRLTSTDPTATPQVQSLSFGGYGPQINTGTLIPSADYRQTYLNNVSDDLAKQSNYGWHIDQLNAYYFTHMQARPAPWILQSNALSLPSDLELDSNLAVETLGDLYRNRQVLKGVINSAIFEDDFTGNGFATSFTLRYPIATGTFPIIILNGQTQTVGLKGTSGSNFYYAIGDLTIAQDGSSLVLSGTDTGTISYTGTFTDTVTVDNVSAQTALALVEGGTGIIEAVEDVSSKNMGYDAAVTYGTQLLTAYCISGRQAVFKTYRNGLAVGQMLPAYIPEENLLYAQLLIHEIQMGMQTQPNNTVLYNYLVTASELPALASWSKLVASGFKY